MSILIVCESQFGNTRAVADAIAEGLQRDNGSSGSPPVRVVPVEEAPREIPDDVTSLLVGGPTHAFSMTRRETRADAVKQGAPEGHEEMGIREWIGQVRPRPDLPVYTFDTRVHVKLIPGSAAKKAAEALRERGFQKAERGRTFWVESTPGPSAPRSSRRRGRGVSSSPTCWPGEQTFHRTDGPEGWASPFGVRTSRSETTPHALDQQVESRG